jgi:hypothetical protein
VKVIICDDLGDTATNAVETIALAGADVQAKPLVREAFKKDVEHLRERERACIEGRADWTAAPLEMEACDILIVDNNLTQLELPGERLVADRIIGSVRAYARAPYIVELNRHEDVDFDLAHLMGDSDSLADLGLNVRHLEFPALWRKGVGSQGGFTPWYWPDLAGAADRRRRQIEVVRSRFREPVLSVLGVPAVGLLDYLSPQGQGELYPVGADADAAEKPIAAVTFEDVFLSWRRAIGLGKDREKILTRFDDPEVSHAVARVVAADIERWIRRNLLAPQSLLVDIPHLTMRMPFLLGEGASDLGRWNRAVNQRTPPYGFNAEIYDRHLAGASFDHDTWLGVPAFWWPTLKNDAELAGMLYEGGNTNWADGIFCEDTSTFVSGDEQHKYSEFTAEVEGSWGHRFVAKIPGTRYQPSSRFRSRTRPADK